MKKNLPGLFLLCFFHLSVYAQNIVIEGLVVENKEQKTINAAEVKVYNKTTDQLVVSTYTDAVGMFSVLVPAGNRYSIEIFKEKYKFHKTRVSTKKKSKDKKVFVKIKMHGRKTSPGETIVAETVPAQYEEIPKIRTHHPETPFTDTIGQIDPYTQITNATRLTAENYNSALDREAMKREKMPTNYTAPNVKDEEAETKINQTALKTLDSYETAVHMPPHSIPIKPYPGETPVIYNRARGARTTEIPPGFTGYAIEFLIAVEPLPANHTIFKRHGIIYLDQKENGFYSYFIGNFKTRTEAEVFLKEIILPTYPGATLVFFNQGKRGRKVSLPTKKKSKTSPPK